ncbi:hypothetical protein [Streptomyces sp. KR80]|uniref:hypothetical protein n=1 Tax=Streptomyces sp. KR80 TaxID=3457426 RepID=UPI003FD2A037
MKRRGIADVAEILAASLGVEFALRESSYKGGEYYLYQGADGLEISIEAHWRDEDGILAEPDFPQFSVLVYVNHIITGMDEKLAAVDGLELLRCEVV